MIAGLPLLAACLAAALFGVARARGSALQQHASTAALFAASFWLSWAIFHAYAARTP